jgi:light-regulated signal transduction histidine kinase (bacteriophytochrome)
MIGNKKTADIFDQLTHDVKSPLVKIKSVVAILANNSKIKKHKDVIDYLKKIDDQANSLNELTDLLTDFVYLKDKKLNLFFELIDSESFIAEIKETMGNRTKNLIFKNESVVKKSIVVDKKRIFQTIDTLAMINEGLKGKIHVGTVLKRNNFTLVMTLPGNSKISYSMINNFDLDRMSTKEERKLLIKLSVALEVVRLHGGGIKIKQELNRTILLLTLPLAQITN